jgi:hypothetical protein
MTSKSHNYPDGSRYEGGWKNEKRHGYGTWSRPDGTKYAGEWLNDNPMGRAC